MKNSGAKRRQVPVGDLSYKLLQGKELGADGDGLAEEPLRGVGGVALDAVVDGVAFDRLATSFDDETTNLIDGEQLGRGGAGIVIDQLVTDGAVEIVGPIGKCCLRGADAEHDPVGLHVRDVVEHQSADSHHTQVHQRRWLLDVRKARVFWVKRQWNEDLKTIGLILEFAQANQVVDAVVGVFDMAVEHRAVGLHTHLMRGAVDFEPLAGVGLVFANAGANFGVEDLGTTAGHASHASFAHLFENRADRLFGEELKPIDFYSSPGFEVQIRKVGVQQSDEFEVPLVFSLMVQTTDDVQLGTAVVDSLLAASDDLGVVHRIAFGLAKVAAKGAERAAVDADVRGVEVGVDVVVGVVAVLPLTDKVGQSADFVKRGVLVGEEHAVVERESLSSLHFIADVFQTRAGGLDEHGESHYD